MAFFDDDFGMEDDFGADKDSVDFQDDFSDDFFSDDDFDQDKNSGDFQDDFSDDFFPTMILTRTKIPVIFRTIFRTIFPTTLFHLMTPALIMPQTRRQRA